MSRWSRTTLVGAGMLLAACTRPASEAAPVDTAEDQAAINAVRQHEAALAQMGNADSMMAVYTDDVKFMPPGEPGLEGIAAVKDWATKSFAAGSLTVNYSTSEIMVSGDLAVDRYTGSLTFTPKGGGPGMTEQLKGVHVMRKGADGTWKIAVDVWNTDAPPPPPPPPAKP